MRVEASREGGVAIPRGWRQAERAGTSPAPTMQRSVLPGSFMVAQYASTEEKPIISWRGEGGEDAVRVAMI
jgi:hypothetical protein